MISFFSTTFATIGTSLIVFFAPLLDFVSPPQPTCSLMVTTSEQTQTVLEQGSVNMKEGETITIARTSMHAKNAQSGSIVIESFGTEQHAPVATTTYSYVFTNGTKQAVCSVTANVEPKPVVAPPPVVVLKPPVIKPTPPSVYVPPPINPADITIGSTTVAVGPIALLSGGIVHAGQTISISFLQITNVGSEYARLDGFEITQNGSGVTDVVIGLSTIDDHGGARGLVGGTEGSTPFNKKGVAFAPTNSILAPGEMRLFTIKAILSGNVAPSGTELKLDVTGVDSTASIVAAFPVRGTTWTVVP